MAYKQSAEVSTAGLSLERVAWYALLAVPVVVPAAAGKIPFSSTPWAYNLFVYPKMFVFGWLVGISLLAWMVGVLTGAIEARTVPLRWWLVGFFGLAVVSTVLGLSPMTAFFGGNYHSVGLFVFLLGGSLYLLITQLVTTLRRVTALTWSAVAGGVVVAAIGLMQVLGVDALGSTGPGFIMHRGASLLGNPDFTGTYLIVPAILAASLALSESNSGRRLLAGSAFVLVTTVLVATLTRGAWIGVTIGLVALGVVFARSGGKVVRRSYVVLAAAAALLLPTLIILRDPEVALHRIGNLFGGDVSGSGRIMLWKEALAVIGRHPLLGTGPDSYRLGWYAVRTAASVKLTGLGTLSEDPHNVVLLLAATIGIPAAIAAVGFICAALYSSATAVFSRDAASNRLTYAGWWAALFALCIALVFATNTIPVVAALFGATGVLMAARSKPAEWSPGTRVTLASGAGVFALVALVVSTLTIAADVTLMRAQRVPDKAAAAGRAAAIAPWYYEARFQAMTTFDENVLNVVQSGHANAANDVPVAEQRIRAFIAAGPREYAGYVELAHFLDDAAAVLGPDALRRAAVAADGALEIYPVSSEAAFLKGNALVGLGDNAGAIATLAPLWNIDPKYSKAGIMYAEALRRNGDRADAVAVADQLAVQFLGDQDVARLIERIKSGSTE